MPYITQDARKELDNNERKPDALGELNYEITMLIKDYLDRQGHGYRNYAGVIGMLETIILEYYRRVVVPYEQEKIRENGDIFKMPSGLEKQTQTTGTINIERLKNIYTRLNIAYDQFEYLGGSFKPFYDGIIELANFIKELAGLK